jgi:hypothetical protein
VEKKLKLRLIWPATVADWHDLDAEECLARFLRALEAGRRGRPWQVDPLVEAGRFGWEAHVQRHDRLHRVRLAASAAEERPSAALEWTLTVESEAAATAAPQLRGGEWMVGLALSLACWAVLHERLGKHLALLCALALLIAAGLLLPSLVRRRPAEPGALDPLDEELLARVRRGAELFSAFRLITREWEDAEQASA